MNTIKHTTTITQTYEPPITLEEAATMLRRSVKTLRRLIQNHSLNAFKIGGCWFVRPSEIEAFIQRQLSQTGGNPSC
jgi:excisionase family DNA binding protein